MRINLDQKSLDMEQRDLNYILPAYIRNYLFYSKNEDPVEIVFPMFSSAPHPTKPGVKVPIRWVPELSPEAIEISVDGKDVREASEEEIVVKDEVDEARKEVKAELGIEPAVEMPLVSETDRAAVVIIEDMPSLDAEVAEAKSEEVSPARAAFAEVAKEDPQPTTREIKGPPSGPTLPPGTPLDNMAPRDRGDQRRVAKDLRPEPEIDESKEVEVTIEKPVESSGDISGQ